LKKKGKNLLLCLETSVLLQPFSLLREALLLQSFSLLCNALLLLEREPFFLLQLPLLRREILRGTQELDKFDVPTADRHIQRRATILRVNAVGVVVAHKKKNVNVARTCMR
jgi:hypothetical protein